MAGLGERGGQIARDVRDAARSLAASPVFVLVSVVSLGLGIGLATTVYSEYRSTLFREGAVLAVVGTFLGFVAALAAGRAIAGYVELVSQAMSTSLSDPVLLVGARVALWLVTMLACYLPARRAVHIHPAITLREE